MCYGRKKHNDSQLRNYSSYKHDYAHTNTSTDTTAIRRRRWIYHTNQSFDKLRIFERRRRWRRWRPTRIIRNDKRTTHDSNPDNSNDTSTNTREH
jgi:hypothetical protein